MARQGVAKQQSKYWTLWVSQGLNNRKARLPCKKEIEKGRLATQHPAPIHISAISGRCKRAKRAQWDLCLRILNCVPSFTCDVFADLSLQLLLPFPFLCQLWQVYTVKVRSKCDHSYFKYLILLRQDRGRKGWGGKTYLVSHFSVRKILYRSSK